MNYNLFGETCIKVRARSRPIKSALLYYFLINTILLFFVKWPQNYSFLVFPYFNALYSRTQEHLRQQRRMLGGLSGRMLDLAAKFPQLNYLIQKISMRKRRDAVIMAGVISLCIILILLYKLH
jgi:hypothetical protein